MVASNVYRRRRIMPSLRLTIFGFTCAMQNEAHEPYKVGSSLLSETVMPAGLVTRVLALYRDSARQRARQTLLESLTLREKQVLDLMTDGADNRTMAERLQISYATVRTHTYVLTRARLKPAA